MSYYEGVFIDSNTEVQNLLADKSTDIPQVVTASVYKPH